MLLLVPHDPLTPRRPDEHFAPEAAAARELGVTVVLVDHDALSRSRAHEAVRRVPADPDVVYRGWMLRSEQYRAFSDALTERGARLRTSPSQYRQAHELPGWAGPLAPVTPATEWTTGSDLDRFDDACERLGPGPAVLRDYVKSLKHSWAQAAFIPDTTDTTAARAVACKFVELRGDDFTGGLVVRRFEVFTSAEVRTWWVHGRCSLRTSHPDTPDADVLDTDLTAVAPVVSTLGMPFVTVDVAKRDDGVWRVVELGDGQVSDRPRTTAARDFITALLQNGGGT